MATTSGQVLEVVQIEREHVTDSLPGWHAAIEHGRLFAPVRDRGELAQALAELAASWRAVSANVLGIGGRSTESQC
jgi:hypothetical protein